MKSHVEDRPKITCSVCGAEVQSFFQLENGMCKFCLEDLEHLEHLEEEVEL